MLRILKRAYCRLRNHVGHRRRSADTFHLEMQVMGASVIGLVTTVANVEASVGKLSMSTGESGTILARMEALVEQLSANTDELVSKVDAATASMAEGRPPAFVADINQRDARIINFANAHDGYASQCGVWVNNPVSLEAKEGSVEHSDSNERLLELPFVLAAVLGGGFRRVLDVGGCESLVALHLASSGCEVTAVDPRVYGFTHPRLRVITAGIEDMQKGELFDAVIFLSTIEHIGIGAYGLAERNADDRSAMAAARGMLSPQGVIVLTVPYGLSGSSAFERTYSRATLLELLGHDAQVLRAVVGVRRSRTVWELEANELIAVDNRDIADRVGMVVVRYPDVSG